MCGSRGYDVYGLGCGWVCGDLVGVGGAVGWSLIELGACGGLKFIDVVDD